MACGGPYGWIRLQVCPVFGVLPEAAALVKVTIAFTEDDGTVIQEFVEQRTAEFITSPGRAGMAQTLLYFAHDRAIKWTRSGDNVARKYP